MKLIVTASIQKSELSSLGNTFPLKAIKLAAKKSINGLGKEIKSSFKIPGTKLSKLYLTSSGGAARAIFLLQVAKGNAILVILRLKNDKNIGANMTVNNPRFKSLLDKNLVSILKDIEKDDYEEFEL